jgi:uncharacterized repeat protein (TIGR01451 family)
MKMHSETRTQWTVRAAVAGSLLALAAMAALSVPAGSDAAATACTLTLEQTKQAIADGTIVRQVAAGSATVTNNTDCVVPVSLSIYEMHTDIRISNQTFFDGTAVIFVQPGTTETLRVAVPNCNYQMDLWYGEHPRVLHEIFSPHPTVLGGKIVTTLGFCPQPTPTPSPSPSPSPTPTPSPSTVTVVTNQTVEVVEKKHEGRVTLFKTDDRDITHPGDVLTYRIVLRNPKDEDRTEVKIVDHVPPYLVPLSWSPSDARTDAARRTITWSNVTLSAGSEVTLSFRARVSANAPDGFLLQNVVDASGPGIRLSATDTTQVIAPKVAAAVAPAPKPVPVSAKTGTPIDAISMLLSVSGSLATAGTLLVRKFA